MLCDSLEEWNGMGREREIQEGGDIYVLTADSLCMEEDNTIL